MGILGTVILQATNVRTELNGVLADYAVPIIIGIVVVSVTVGLIKNMDKIIDSNGEGTRKEGVVNVIWYLFYTILIVIIVGAAVTIMNTQFSLSI